MPTNKTGRKYHTSDAQAANSVVAFKHTLKQARRFGPNEVKVQVEEDAVFFENRHDTDPANRAAVGAQLFKQMRRAEQDLRGVHIKLFEAKAFKITNHYLPGEQNEPKLCDYHIFDARPRALPEHAHPLCTDFSELTKTYGDDFENHQIYTHTEPAKRAEEHFAPVPVIGNSALIHNGWGVNQQAIDGLIKNATCTRLLASNKDALPLDLPVDGFTRLVDKIGGDQTAHVRILERWGRPTQTQEQLFRHVASYTKLDKNGNPSRITREFSVHGVHSQPDNLVANLQNGTKYVFVKSGIASAPTTKEPKEGAINRLRKLEQEVIADTPTPKDTTVRWLYAQFDADDEIVGTWQDCEDPYIYVEPSVKTKGKVKFADPDPVEQEPDSLAQLTALQAQGAQSFGLTQDVLDKIHAFGYNDQAIETLFERLYPAREYSLANLTVLREQFMEKVGAYKDFMINVMQLNPGNPAQFFNKELSQDDCHRYQEYQRKQKADLASKTIQDRMERLIGDAEEPGLISQIEHQYEHVIQASYQNKLPKAQTRGDFLRAYTQIETCHSDLEENLDILSSYLDHIGVRPRDNAIYNLGIDHLNSAERLLHQYSQKVQESFYGNATSFTKQGERFEQEAIASGLSIPVEGMTVLRPPVFTHTVKPAIKLPKITTTSLTQQ